MSLTNVVDFLCKVGNEHQAKELLNTFAKHANGLQQYDELGMLFEKVKAYPESLDMLEKCIAIARTPDELHSVRSNISKIYNLVNEPLKSIHYSSINIKQYPNDYEARMEQSFSYYLYGDTVRSHQIQQELLDIPELPDNVKKRITFNMGTFEMTNGNFKSGLYKMIMGGKEIGIWHPHIKPYPKWTGKETDKTILVFAEAGLGDEIIHIRFMKALDTRGLKALWVGHNDVTLKLFKANGFNVIKEKDIPKGDYVYCESMSLPILLDLNKEDLWSGTYLTPKQEYIDKWRAILPEKFITMRWAGNPYYDHDLHRTINFDMLFTGLKKFNLPIVSLQIDGSRYEGEDMINVEIESWEDTLAIQHLAKVNVTSCTSVAHSASAIGAKCVVLPPIAIYFPWVALNDDNTSMWYGKNTKVFTQCTWRDWTVAVNKTIDYLETIL